MDNPTNHASTSRRVASLPGAGQGPSAAVRLVNQHPDQTYKALDSPPPAFCNRCKGKGL